MAPIFFRNVQGSATHAFVIGVGGYGDAKFGRGAKPELRKVKDLPSAADSARFMVDWLIANQDALAAPLASIHLLISDPGVVTADQKRYNWVNPFPFSGASSANVKLEGQSWIASLTKRVGDVAFFYACGHGAGLSTQPVLFLDDLNSDPINPWAHHNIGVTASSFKQLAAIKTGFFFTDTCREFIPKFELGSAQDLSRFAPPFDPFGNTGTDKISLLCGTTDTQLSYEGQTASDPAVRLGRFTQMLSKALDGVSCRRRGTQWTVHPGAIFEDLKIISRLYRPDWRKEAFEPSLPMLANEVFPIIYPPNPKVPVVVYTDPEEEAKNFYLRIFNNSSRQTPWLAERESRGPGAWLAEIPASLMPHYAVAAAEDPTVFHQEIFVPNAPNFDQRISVR